MLLCLKLFSKEGYNENIYTASNRDKFTSN